MDTRILLGIIVVFVIIVSIVVNAKSPVPAPASTERRIETTISYTPDPVDVLARRLLATPKQVGRPVSKGEAECRRVLERIYGVPFPSVRPDWLQSTETGRNLEVDCYAELDAASIGLGFSGTVCVGCEYNGAQHTRQVPSMQTEYQFNAQQWNDEYKRQICEARGVHLIIVPYTVRLTDIKEYITNELEMRSLLPRRMG